MRTIVILLISLLLFSEAYSQDRYASAEEIQMMHQWMNGVRAQKNLDSLKLITAEYPVAFNNRWAQYVCEEKFVHSREGAEIIARCYAHSLRVNGFIQACISWLGSKPHYKIMMDPDTKYVLFGGYVKDNKYYVVANFYAMDMQSPYYKKHYRKMLKKVNKGNYL